MRPNGLTQQTVDRWGADQRATDQRSITELIDATGYLDDEELKYWSGRRPNYYKLKQQRVTQAVACRCGASLIKPRRGSPRKWCSNRCRMAASREGA